MSSYRNSNDLILNSKYDNCNYYNESELTENLRDKLKQVLKTRSISGTQLISSSKADMIETVQPEFAADDWKFTEKGDDNHELVSKESLPFGSFEPGSVERSIHDELLLLLHGCLQKAQDKLCRRIMLPIDMLKRLAVEVQNMARSEPYGLRGAVLYLHLEQPGNRTTNLGKVECNSHVASTFEVNITLTEDVKRWCTIKDLVVRGLFGYSELYMAPGYKIEKRKLYRSHSPTTC